MESQQEEQREQPKPAVQQPSPTKLSFNPWMLSTFALLILLALTGIYALSQKQKEASTTPQPTTLPPLQSTSTPLPTQDPTVGWEIYINKDLGISLRYPKDATVQELPEIPKRILIIFIGEEQRKSGRTQTELFDGYSVSLRRLGDTSQTSPSAVAQETLNSAKDACPPGALFSPITPTTLADRQVQSYTIKGCLGDYTEYFIVNGNDILEITQLYVGETEKQMHYRQISNQILSTFQFLDDE